ncbi:hypothetical protein D3C76_1789030 [compost metagenome]
MPPNPLISCFSEDKLMLASLAADTWVGVNIRGRAVKQANRIWTDLFKFNFNMFTFLKLIYL